MICTLGGVAEASARDGILPAAGIQNDLTMLPRCLLPSGRLGTTHCSLLRIRLGVPMAIHIKALVVVLGALPTGLRFYVTK